MMNCREVSMTRLSTVALAMLAGLAGGILSHYALPPVAFAQNRPPSVVPLPPVPRNPVVPEMRAQSFTLVDGSDRTIGTFTYEPVSRSLLAANRIVLRDQQGRELWSAGGPGVRPLTAVTSR
jgi:hypothetical protein